MRSRAPHARRGWLLVGCLATVLACASDLERGEHLYRQGDLRGALHAWRSADATDARIDARVSAVEREFRTLLRRYDKRALFLQQRDRLAEALLYYRLELKLDPSNRRLLDRVQTMARELQRQVHDTAAQLQATLSRDELQRAGPLADRLEELDPFDPVLEVEIRRARRAISVEARRFLTHGQQAFAAGNRELARRSFRSALALEPHNQTALGYLSYLQRFEEAARRGEEDVSAAPPLPETLSAEQLLAEGHFHAGEQAESQGEPYRAIAEYEAVLRIEPGHTRARSHLEGLRSRLRARIPDLYEIGKRFFQDEDLPNAVRVWRQVLLIDPDQQRTRNNVERAERMLSRLEEIQTGGHD
ncbi:MAG: hypothetical protein ACE5IL_06940 [Myxococcota bacterium]